ncbi:MAG: DUF892 family protein [Geminicoccaceae bacterium]
MKALPKMQRAARSDDLKAAFDKHKQETEGMSSACGRCSTSSASAPGADLRCDRRDRR